MTNLVERLEPSKHCNQIVVAESRGEDQGAEAGKVVGEGEGEDVEMDVCSSSKTVHKRFEVV